MVPERELAEPIVFDRSFNAMQRAVRWRASPDVHPYGWVDLGSLVRPSRDVCVFATTFVRGASHVIELPPGTLAAAEVQAGDEVWLVAPGRLL